MMMLTMMPIRYYNKVSGMMPKSSAILTLGCAKYRLLGQDFGTVPGTNLPRLLDMGQCNDAYGAVRIPCVNALLLRHDWNCDVEPPARRQRMLHGLLT